VTLLGITCCPRYKAVPIEGGLSPTACASIPSTLHALAVRDSRAARALCPRSPRHSQQSPVHTQSEAAVRTRSARTQSQVTRTLAVRRPHSVREHRGPARSPRGSSSTVCVTGPPAPSPTLPAGSTHQSQWTLVQFETRDQSATTGTSRGTLVQGNLGGHVPWSLDTRLVA
jgi:hypothetical protein